MNLKLTNTLASLVRLLAFACNTEGQNLITVSSKTEHSAMDSFFPRVSVVPRNRALTSGSRQSSRASKATSLNTRDAIWNEYKDIIPRRHNLAHYTRSSKNKS